MWSMTTGKQGFEQDSHLAASPSFQSWEALQPLSDTADLFKQAASKCNVMSGDEIEEKSSLIKSDHSDLRCSIASKEGITGQGVLAVAEDHASGEVATACDNKGGEEQQQRSRSVEVSIFHYHKTLLSDILAVPPETLYFSSSNKSLTISPNIVIFSS